MIKALYISLWCVQADEFLKNLKSDLENRGITGIEVNEKREEIRTRDFIVTAKSINSGCIILDCEFADYYIFDIKTDEIENEKYRNIILAKIKNLRCCFKCKAKQLTGKDELIKILIGD